MAVMLLAACGGDGEEPRKGKERNRDTEATPTAEPTTEPTAEPTGEPTGEPVPIPTPTEVPGPSVGGPDVKYPNTALLAFGYYLDAKLKPLSDQDLALVRYGVILLNDDEIPELWWTEGGSHVNSVNICMYDGEKVLELGSFGSFGSCRYRKQGGIIASGYTGMGADQTSIYTLSGTKVSETVNYLEQTIMLPEGTQTNYYKNDVPITLEDYIKGMAEWDLESMNYIDYAEGVSLFAPTSDGGTYRFPTTYTGMYESYVSMFTADPSFYGIPEDILERLTGEWKLIGGEVEGWEWKAEEEGITGKWIFEPNGEAEITEGESVDMYRLTYIPRPIFEGLDLWCVTTPRHGNPGYTYYISIKQDGTIIMFDTNPDEYYSAVRYYEKVK